jgi:hypothetical protein
MSASVIINTIYFPRVGDAPLEPVPYTMTEPELVRFLRLENAPHPSKTIRYYRERGILKAVQVGKNVRFLLPDVLEFLEKNKEANPR